MLNVNSLDVEEAWTVIASNLVNTCIPRSSGNTRDQIISFVKRSLKERGNAISNVLKNTTDYRNIDEIKQNLEYIDSFEAIQPTYLNTTEAGEDFLSKPDKCLTPAQIDMVKKGRTMFHNIDWQGSLFQDYLVQEGVLSDDGCRSISDRNSDHEQHWAIFHFVLSLSSTDIFNKILPILEIVGHNDIAQWLKLVQRVKDDGEALSLYDIMNLVNPRRMADALLKNNAIDMRRYFDLLSPCILSSQKMRILLSVQWDHFLQALKEKYPHFYEICPQIKPEQDRRNRTSNSESDMSEIGQRFDLTDSNLSDVARHSDLTEFSELTGSNQDTRCAVRPERPPSCPVWCNCGKCQRMNNKLDEICCGPKRGTDCFGYGKEVETLIGVARPLVCFLCSWFKNKSEVHRQARQALYRQVSIILHGRTGPGHRQRIPSCCIRKIRSSFPDPRGQYTGFRESIMQANISNPRARNIRQNLDRTKCSQEGFV